MPPILLPLPRSMKVSETIVPFPQQVREETNATLPPQGYRLTIDATGVTLTAADAAGHFYGRQTLAQLRRQYDDRAPALTIEDSPDFAQRGVMLDISRDKVPTMETLFAIVDQMAALKLNHLQLYTEHTFAYRNHAEVWQNASPMTADEVCQLDAYCRERFIELVPNQNSFGHLERWLVLDRYKPLAEAPEGFTWPSGLRCETPFSLNPTDPRSLELLDELYAELLPNFTSCLFNVGCDETFDLGVPGSRSEAICRERGTHQVYLDFLKQIHARCGAHGRRMMFWGDIIIESPELVPELPKDAIALEWGYEADHPFDDHLAKFKAAGLEFYVCPGTSSWLSFAGRTDNAIANLRSAAEAGLKHGAIGYLITDWGDWGHLQYWPVSLPPIAYGAGVAWCAASNAKVDHRPAVDLHVFHDPSGVVTGVLHDLGNVHAMSKYVKNSAMPFRILQERADHSPSVLKDVSVESLRQMEEAIQPMIARIENAQLHRPGGQLTLADIRQTAAMLRHALRRGRWRLGDADVTAAALHSELQQIITEHRRLWLARNREGGLSDSVNRLNERLAEYGRPESVQRSVGVSPT